MLGGVAPDPAIGGKSLYEISGAEAADAALFEAIRLDPDGAALDAAEAAKVKVTWHRLGFSVAELSETNGIVTVPVTGLPMYDASNGVVSAVVVTPVDGIAQ